MSLNLLNMFTQREYYDRFKGFVNTSALSKEERQLFKDIAKWYDSSSTADIDWNIFRGWFFTVAHPKMGENNTDIYNNIIDKLDEYPEPDEAFAKVTIQAFLTREMCGKAAELSLAGYEGDRNTSLEELQEVLDEYSGRLSNTEDVEQYLVNDDIEDLVADVTTGGLEWRHEELNKSVGNLRVGKLVCFGARPNAGKTSWLVDNVTHMASQLEDDEYVLWFNNEEAGKEVKFRIVQGGIKRTSKDIKDDMPKAKADYVKAVGAWDKIQLIDKSDLSIADVERILKQFEGKVGLIIFDQLWKVHGFTNESDVQRLQVLYQWAREKAKQHAPVIATHQADITAEGMKELNMSQLHMNKTGIQGECDTIIMMGKSHEPTEATYRYFHIAKNKGAYGPKVDAGLIEHKYILTLYGEVARYG